MTEKRELNEYLAAEWGEDWERATEDWPFALTKAGEVGGEPVYRFTDGDEEFFAFGGSHLRVHPVAGMSMEDLRLQELGRRWIGERDPVDHHTSRLGDERVPSGLERRAAVERIASGRRVVEGLFLAEEQRYVVLVESEGAEDLLTLEGDPPLHVPRMAAAGGWRRMSHAIGVMLDPPRAASGGAPAA